jgi:hypothetical protein
MSDDVDVVILLEDGIESDTFGNQMCCDCKHYRNDDNDTCLAFPDGIPLEIFWHGVDHTNPYTGDNGIQFEPK